MRKFDLSLRSSRSSYFATFRHQLTILSKTDALDEEKWLNMLGTLDRKSGSAGMPRPISYAVFCLKKKNRTATRSVIDIAPPACVGPGAHPELDVGGNAPPERDE